MSVEEKKSKHGKGINLWIKDTWKSLLENIKSRAGGFILTALLSIISAILGFFGRGAAIESRVTAAESAINVITIEQKELEKGVVLNGADIADLKTGQTHIVNKLDEASKDIKQILFNLSK